MNTSVSSGRCHRMIFLPTFVMCGVLPVLSFSKLRMKIGDISISAISRCQLGTTALGQITATGLSNVLAR